MTTTRNRGQGSTPFEGLKHWHLRMPTALSDRIDLALLDPITGRARYGAKSQLVEQLLREWLYRLEEEQPAVAWRDDQ
jgi:hypothetical protein